MTRIRATSKATSALLQAMRWLERREYFPEELRAKLLRADWPEPDVEDALAYLQGKGLLSEERAMDAALLRRSGKRAVGRVRMIEELEAKGADTSRLAELYGDDQDERQRAVQLLSMKFPNGTTIVKASRFLASRGFEEEVIVSVVESLEAD